MHSSQFVAAMIVSAVVLFCGAAQATPALADKPPAVSSLIVQAGFKCGLVDGKLVCGSEKSGAKESDNDPDDKPKKKKNTGNICLGDNNCGAGYTDLETPNKYGACCQAADAAPKEAEKCKFPGEIGTPPNCQCPDGTEFLGYKGCVKYTSGRWCEKAYVASVMNQILSQRCSTEYSHGSFECHDTKDELYDECCCTYRKF